MMGTTTRTKTFCFCENNVGVYVQNDGDYDGVYGFFHDTQNVGVYVQNDGDYDKFDL